VRVVSLLPSATEIVFALGRGDDVVGVTFECDYPPEARSRRVVSTSSLPTGLSPGEIDAAVAARLAAGEDLYKLDAGAMADLDADVVLTQDLCAVCAVDIERVDDALAYLGCQADVVTLDPRSVAEVLASIETVGAALGAAEPAAALVASLRARLEAVASAVAGAPTPRVLLLEWTDPPFSAGHWIPDLVTAAGGEPLLAHPGADSQRLGWETIDETRPDVVVVAPCGYHLDDSFRFAEQVARRFADRTAVWAVDADAYIVRPGPRVVDGVEVLAQVLHPARCGEPDAIRARRVPAGG
jgi:iron complex transport system substrate-binding protein